MASNKQRLVTFLSTCEKDREVPRDMALVESLADALLKGLVFEPCDLAEIRAEDFNLDQPGLRGFLTVAIRAARAIWAPQQEAHNAALVNQSQLAVLSDKKSEKKEKVHVNLTHEWSDLSLSTIPANFQPSGQLVDSIATELKAQKERGIATPYIYTSMDKFLPPWVKGFCSEAGCDEADGEKDSHTVREIGRVLGVQRKKAKFLSLVEWSAAYDLFALAMVATHQMSLVATVAHRSNCIRIANSAFAEKRRHPLAVHYDSLVRQSWAHRAFNQEVGFDVNAEALKIDRDILERARELFDAYKKVEDDANDDAEDTKGKGNHKSFPYSNSYSSYGHRGSKRKWGWSRNGSEKVGKNR